MKNIKTLAKLLVLNSDSSINTKQLHLVHQDLSDYSKGKLSEHDLNLMEISEGVIAFLLLQKNRAIQLKKEIQQLEETSYGVDEGHNNLNEFYFQLYKESLDNIDRITLSKEIISLIKLKK